MGAGVTLERGRTVRSTTVDSACRGKPSTATKRTAAALRRKTHLIVPSFSASRVAHWPNFNGRRGRRTTCIQDTRFNMEEMESVTWLDCLRRCRWRPIRRTNHPCGVRPVRQFVSASGWRMTVCGRVDVSHPGSRLKKRCHRWRAHRQRGRKANS